MNSFAFAACSAIDGVCWEHVVFIFFLRTPHMPLPILSVRPPTLINYNYDYSGPTESPDPSKQQRAREGNAPALVCHMIFRPLLSRNYVNAWVFHQLPVHEKLTGGVQEGTGLFWQAPTAPGNPADQLYILPKEGSALPPRLLIYGALPQTTVEVGCSHDSRGHVKLPGIPPTTTRRRRRRTHTSTQPSKVGLCFQRRLARKNKQ